MRFGILRVKLGSFTKFAFGFAIFSAEHVGDSGSEVRFREITIQLQSASGRLRGLFHPLGISVELVFFKISEGEAGVGGSVVVVEFDGVIQQRNRTIQVVGDIPPLEVSLGLTLQIKRSVRRSFCGAVACRQESGEQVANTVPGRGNCGGRGNNGQQRKADRKFPFAGRSMSVK